MNDRNKVKIEDFVRDIIENYEPPYDHEDWKALEKKLVNNNTHPKWKNYIYYAISLISAIFLLTFISFYLNNISENFIFDTNIPNKKEIKNYYNHVNKSNNNKRQLIESKSNNKDKVNSTFILAKKSNENINNQTKIFNNNYNNEETETKNTHPGLTNTLHNNTLNPETPQNNKLAFKNNNIDLFDEINFTIESNDQCENSPIRFVPTYISDTITYLWDFGDGTTTRERTPIHKYKSSGTYKIIMQAYSGIPKNGTIKTKELIIKQRPTAQFEITKSSDYTYNFINNSLNATSYIWYFGDNEFSTNFNPTHTYLKKGEYNVKLIAIHTNGCRDSIQNTINIIQKEEIYVPTSFTPNSDGINDYFFVTGPGLQNIQDFKLVIYNRNGQIVFETTNYESKWDGTTNGKINDNGTYIWIITYRNHDGTQNTMKGSVNIFK